MSDLTQDNTSTSHRPPISRIPLWIVLISPFVILLIIVVGTTNYLAHQNSRSVVDDIAEQLLQEINARIEVHLQSFLEIPERINRNNANMIAHGLLDIENTDAISQYFREQVQIYDSVTSIYFGNPEGGLVSGGREGADGSYYVMISENFEQGALNKYAISANGEPGELLFTVDSFDARIRPWYIGAVENSDANWTAPYALSTGQDLAIASSLPVYDEIGDLMGVASIDIFTSHIRSFLSNLDIGKSGQAYIVEHSGELVTASTDVATFTTQDDGSKIRIFAQESDDVVIATSANPITGGIGGFSDLDQRQYMVTIEGESHYLLITPFHTIQGLDWFIVITIPESDFLGAIEAQTQVTVLLTVLAVIIALLFGTLITLQLLRPITRLSRATTKLSKGDWSQSIKIEGVREIYLLSSAFNKMSQQLYELFSNLEERIDERTKELSISETRYRAVVEDQTELICRFTPDYRLNFHNDAYQRYFSQPDSAIKPSFMAYILDDEESQTIESLANLSTSKPMLIIEHRVMRFDGKVRWLQWIIRALFDDSREMKETQAVGRDVTETKQYEERLQKALDREIELGKLKSQFVTTVSHEFRTPLAVILNSTEILDRYDTRLSHEKKTEHFEKIKKQIVHMTDLMTNVLNVSRNNIPDLIRQEELVDIVAMCKTIIDEVSISLRHHINFRLTKSENCTQVNVDSKLMRLIFINLISNAARYSPANSTVSIDLICNQDNIQCRVVDEGIGIPQKDQENIFEPFFRAENTENITGTGLGLAIVKRSVEQHKGRLSFVSEEGEGTTFTVNLPINKSLEASHE